jgi:hypothetical protein
LEALIVTVFLDLLGSTPEDVGEPRDELYFALYIEGILDAIVDGKTAYYAAVRNNTMYPITIVKG